MLRKTILLTFLLLVFVPALAQVAGEDEVYLNGDKIEAKFQGGNLKKFQEFVFNSLDKTKIEKEGQLICSFTINEEGSLKNIRILKDLGGQSALEMIRVLQLSPKWQPATRNGKPFATTYKIPFTFIRKMPKVDTEEVVHIDVVDNGGKSEEDKIYVAVEKQPEFPGGSDKFMKYFAKNFNSPVQLKDVKVFVGFIVNKDGSLSDVKMLRLPLDNEPLKNEIIRVVSNSPKWMPGIQNGKTVRVQFILPLILTFN
ncbi:energy transducer TonB [Flavobacterium pedocola]